MVGKNVRRFYDTYGWKNPSNGEQYLSDERYGAPDTTLKDEKGSEARYWRYFANGGLFVLDAGCGAKPITQIGERFQRHVCVDASLTGLVEARRKVGAQGLYVVADLCALPFKDQVFDGVVASYCLYQIERNEQISVLKEFYRVARTGRNIVVFYIAKNSLISMAHRLANAIMQMSDRLRILFLGQNRGDAEAVPPPDFYLQSPSSLSAGFRSVDITCLRTLSRVECSILQKMHMLDPALRIFSMLESKFPHAMLLIGAYATIKIRKTT